MKKEKEKKEGIHLVQLHSVWCYFYYKVQIVYLKIVCKKNIYIYINIIETIVIISESLIDIKYIMNFLLKF